MKKNNLALLLLLTVLAPSLGSAAEAPAPSATLPAEKPEAPTGKPGTSTEPRATPAWQNVFTEAGRRVEIDNASIKKMPDGKIQAYGRILFDKPLPDAASGGTYQILEALNTYDCDKRSFATTRRIYRKDDQSQLRDEPGPNRAELPVRSGSLDERIMRAACRPGGSDNKASFNSTVSKAKAAAEASLPEARKELMRNELGSSQKPAPVVRAPVLAAPVATPAKAARPAAPHKHSEVVSYENVQWSYEGLGGPENWGKLSPNNKLCDTGKRQSPIDLRDGILVDLEPIVFNYRPSQFRIIDNGHTIQAGVSDNRISLLGKDYELVQFHFHRPSEERINGRSFEMAVHLVHKSIDGQIAIVALLIERGSEHPVVQTLWNYLPLERHTDVYPPGVVIDLDKLLPEKRGYATYMGSLATPPCTEGVRWLIMQTPIQLSPEQIGIFARLYPGNARPIQPQNGRLIKQSR
jgi:carbonic anhydrase